jgi:heme-degrading monooxygenase HmoA
MRTVALVHHRVDDFDAWRSVYDSFAPVQKERGVLQHHVWRSQDDPHLVAVVHTFASPAEAKAFFDASELAEAMTRAGVDASSVEVEYLDEISFASTSTSRDPGVTEPGITGPETDTHRVGGPL